MSKTRDTRSEIDPSDRCPTMILRNKAGDAVTVNAAPQPGDEFDPAAVRAHKRAKAEHDAMLAAYAKRGYAPEGEAAADADEPAKRGPGRPRKADAAQSEG